MKRIVSASALAIGVCAAGWLATPLTAAPQKGGGACTLASLPASFRLVGQGGVLGGINGTAPTYIGGIGRQIRVGTATFADLSTSTLVAISGGTVGTSSTVEMFTFDATNGALSHVLTLAGLPATDYKPMTMGDFNADGIPDIAVGTGQAERAYVYLSNSQTTLSYAAPLLIAAPAGTNLFGRWLAAANLDLTGGDELIIGAPGRGTGKSAVIGKVFVYRFTGSGFDSGSALDTSTLALKTDDDFGWRVAAADVNNDGWPDILATSPHRDVNATDSGATYVFFGPGFTSLSLLATSLRDDQLGNVMGLDANGDQFGDVVVTTGLVGFNSTPRRAIVYTGAITGNRTTVQSPDYSIAAINQALSDGWGTGIGTGDLNGDGISDVLVGAPNAGSGSCASIGAAHIFISDFAHPTTPAGYLLQPPALNGGNWNAYGWSVSAVSAIQPDTSTAGHPGYLLVGEPGRDINGITSAGNVYVYRVCTATFPC